MDPAALEMIAPVLVFLGLSGAVLIGMRLRYAHKERMRLDATSQADVERLGDAVNALRDEVQVLRDGYLELNERVEFTERLLERPKADSDVRHGRNSQ